MKDSGYYGLPTLNPPQYFESLTKHAVPLDERAIAALANSPMALDVYAWLVNASAGSLRL
jgi:hypothetical protein